MISLRRKHYSSILGPIDFTPTCYEPKHGALRLRPSSLLGLSLSPFLAIDPQCRFVCHVAAAAAVFGSWAHSAFLPSR